MQILEFVQLAEVDPRYFETSYYAAPDRGGERAYALLLEALRRSSLVGIAQVAMHRREHVVVIRPGTTGIVLHTMYYEEEVRRENEYRTDTSRIAQKELDLALLLVNSLSAPFEAAKYRDGYREKLDALIAAKLQGKALSQTVAPRLAPVVNMLEALKRSLESTVRKSGAPLSPAGRVIVVRYADDLVAGFESRVEAEQFLNEFRERLAQFGLELHPEKTRLIEFGRFAAQNRKQRGEGKPETFAFLGFTHYCGKLRSTGAFTVWRKTANKRMVAKLQTIKAELRRRMHSSPALVGEWLHKVTLGYYQYHAVPTTYLS